MPAERNSDVNRPGGSDNKQFLRLHNEVLAAGALESLRGAEHPRKEKETQKNPYFSTQPVKFQDIPKPVDKMYFQIPTPSVADVIRPATLGNATVNTIYSTLLHFSQQLYGLTLRYKEHSDVGVTHTTASIDRQTDRLLKKSAEQHLELINGVNRLTAAVNENSHILTQLNLITHDLAAIKTSVDQNITIGKDSMSLT